MTVYPEHDRMHEIAGLSQAIGEFLDNSPYTLCELEDEMYWPVRQSIQRILADYFKIDLDKIEAEKLAILDELHAAGGA